MPDAAQRPRVVLRYPPGSLAGDYLRALAGAGLALGLLIAIDTAPVVTAVCIALLVIFGGFGLRTLARQISRIVLDSEGVTLAGVRRKEIAWEGLSRLRLRYYGNRRQRASGGGFLQLILEDGGRRIAVESGLERFDGLAWLTARHAQINGAEIDGASLENLLALGIDPEKAGPPPPEGAPLADFAPHGARA